MKTHIAFTFLITSLLLTFSGCAEKTNIESLEGYWEIEKVDLPEGNVKEYSISTTIDHYTLETDSTGYKTKVMPQLDGSFKTSGKAEYFTLSEENGRIQLNFATPLTEHTETLVRLKEEQLILVNDREMKYTYKRFKKLELE